MLLVDAANVVGSRPDGWWKDRAGAARSLVGRLRAAVAAGDLVSPVVVVLEGKARAGAPVGEEGGVTVRHAEGSGDDELVAVASVPHDTPVTLVTADRDLRRRTEVHGVTTVGPGWLLDRLS